MVYFNFNNVEDLSFNKKLFALVQSNEAFIKILQTNKKLILESKGVSFDYEKVRSELVKVFDNKDLMIHEDIINSMSGSDNVFTNTKEIEKQYEGFLKKKKRITEACGELIISKSPTFEEYKKKSKELYSALVDGIKEIQHLNNIKNVLKEFVDSNKDDKKKKEALNKIKTFYEKIRKGYKEQIEDIKSLREDYKNGGRLDKIVIFDKEYWKKRFKKLTSNKTNEFLNNILEVIKGLSYLSFHLGDPASVEYKNLSYILNEYMQDKAFHKLKNSIKSYYENNAVDRKYKTSINTAISSLLKMIEEVENSKLELENIDKKTSEFFQKNKESFPEISKKVEENRKDIHYKSLNNKLNNKMSGLKNNIECLNMHNNINNKTIEELSKVDDLMEDIESHLNLSYPEEGSLSHFLMTIYNESEMDKLIAKKVFENEELAEKLDREEFMEKTEENIHHVEFKPVNFKLGDVSKEEKQQAYIESIVNLMKNHFNNTKNIGLEINDIKKFNEVVKFYKDEMSNLESLKNAESAEELEFNQAPILLTEARIKKDEDLKKKELNALNEKLKELKDLIDSIKKVNSLLFYKFDTNNWDEKMEETSCLLGSYRNDYVFLNKLHENWSKITIRKFNTEEKKTLDEMKKEIDDIKWSELTNSKKGIKEKFKDEKFLDKEFGNHFTDVTSIEEVKEKDDDETFYYKYKEFLSFLNSYIKLFIKLREKFEKIDNMILNKGNTMSQIMQLFSNKYGIEEKQK